MSQQCSSEQQVPDWFFLEKYNICASMDLDAWKCALIDRAQILSCGQSKAQISSRGGGLSRSIESLFINAISKVGTIYAAQPKSYPGRANYEIDFPDEVNCIEPLKVQSLFSLANRVLETEKGSKYRLNLQKEEPPDSYHMAREYWDISNSSFDVLEEKKEDDYFWYEHAFIHARIDLLAPEETLLNSFAEYIRVMKDKFQIVDEKLVLLREADFKKYHKHKVLPYIDLSLWFEYKDIQVTHQQMGLLLFPDQYQRPLDDRIRRTVKPLADKLMAAAEFF